MPNEGIVYVPVDVLLARVRRKYLRMATQRVGIFHATLLYLLLTQDHSGVLKGLL